MPPVCSSAARVGPCGRLQSVTTETAGPMAGPHPDHANNWGELQQQAAEGGAGAEVQDEADAKAGGAEIVQELHLVGLYDLLTDFRLDEYSTLDDQVGPVLPDDAAPEPNDQRHLALRAHASRGKRHRQGTLVHRLEKSMPEPPVCLLERPNDLARDIPVYEPIVFTRSSPSHCSVSLRQFVRKCPW